jgi:hypothetical protein
MAKGIEVLRREAFLRRTKGGLVLNEQQQRGAWFGRRAKGLLDFT